MIKKSFYQKNTNINSNLTYLNLNLKLFLPFNLMDTNIGHTNHLEYKVCVIGNVSVGKSALSNRLQYDSFESDYKATVGAGYCPYRLNTSHGKSVELQIWDTAGTERYKTLSPIYFRDSSAAIIVYDQSNNESFLSLKEWLKSYKEYSDTNPVICIAANKSDLPETERLKENNEAAKNWCQAEGYLFFETSAAEGKNVKEMFQEVSEKLVERKHRIQPDSGIQVNNSVKSEKKRCC